MTGSRPTAPQNWLSSQDIANLFMLAGFDVIKREWRVMSPFWLFGLGRLINKYVATLPVIRKLSLRNYVIARPQAVTESELSVSVVVPCHRVIGADASLTGYGGGIERKRWLLEHEGAEPLLLRRKRPFSRRPR